MILFVVWNKNFSFLVQNNDNYITSFEQFIANGWYQESLYGTSVFYNGVLFLIYQFTDSVQMSFFILNLTCQLTIIIIGVLILKKKATSKNKLLYFSVLALYFFKTLMLSSYIKAYNDTFLGVFVMLISYILIFKIDNVKYIKTKYIYLIGLFLALTFSIRPTAILLTILIVIFFVFWMLKHQHGIMVFFKICLIISFSTLIPLGMIHYPSLKKNQTLSFYSKNNKEYNLNWSQRNFLAVSKIEEQQIDFSNRNIWKTKFSDVKTYLELNGEDALPKNQLESILKSPYLYFKIMLFNVLKTFGWIVRFSGVLFFIPLCFLFQTRKYAIENIGFTMFLSFTLILVAVLFSTIEFRWFIGYEILIYLAILRALQKLSKTYNKSTYIAIAASLVLVTLFNIRSILMSL